MQPNSLDGVNDSAFAWFMFFLLCHRHFGNTAVPAIQQKSGDWISALRKEQDCWIAATKKSAQNSLDQAEKILKKARVPK